MDKDRQVKLPVLVSMEELFMLSQPSSANIKKEPQEAKKHGTDIPVDEPVKKKLKPSRPLKNKNRPIKIEAVESKGEKQVTLKMGSFSPGKPNDVTLASDDKVKSMQAMLDEKEKMIDDLQEQFAIVQSENLYKTAELKDLQNKVKELEDDNRKLSLSVGGQIKSAAEILKTINSIKSKINQEIKKDKDSSSPNEIQNLQKKIKKLVSEKSDLMYSVSMMKKNASNNSHTDCDKKVKDLTIERMNLFQHLTDENDKVAGLEKKLKEIQAALLNSIDDNSSLRKNHDSLTKAMKNLKCKMENFSEDRQKLVSANSKISLLEEEVTKLKMSSIIRSKPAPSEPKIVEVITDENEENVDMTHPVNDEQNKDIQSSDPDDQENVDDPESVNNDEENIDDPDSVDNEEENVDDPNSVDLEEEENVTESSNMNLEEKKIKDLEEEFDFESNEDEVQKPDPQGDLVDSAPKDVSNTTEKQNVEESETACDQADKGDSTELPSFDSIMSKYQNLVSKQTDQSTDVVNDMNVDVEELLKDDSDTSNISTDSGISESFVDKDIEEGPIEATSKVTPQKLNVSFIDDSSIETIQQVKDFDPTFLNSFPNSISITEIDDDDDAETLPPSPRAPEVSQDNCTTCGTNIFEDSDHLVDGKCSKLMEYIQEGLEVSCDYCEAKMDHWVSACNALVSFCEICHCWGHTQETHIADTLVTNEEDFSVSYSENEKLEKMLQEYNKFRTQHFSHKEESPLPENSLDEGGRFKFSGTMDDVQSIIKAKSITFARESHVD